MYKSDLKPLDPVEVWMVRRNIEYVKTEGLEIVVDRLKVQGYNRVAAAVATECADILIEELNKK